MNLLHRVKEEAIRVKTIMPRYLQLEISKECNLKCVGCYRRDNTSLVDLGGEKNLTLGMLKYILDILPTVRTVSFLGDGEPLMNKELNQLMNYLTSKNISIWITTNGTMIKQETVNMWENYRLTEVHVSLDSVQKDIYEKMRPGAYIEKVMHTINMMGRSKLSLYLNFLAYQETISDLPELMRLAVENHCKGVNVLSPIFLTGSDVEGELTRVIDDARNREYLSEAAKIAKENGVVWIGGVPELSPFFRHCNFPFALPYITLNGDVYGCCYAVGGGRTEWYKGVPQKIRSSDYLMGNIYKDSLKDIWSGENYKGLRKAVKASEHPRGYKMNEFELLELRSTDTDRRYSYCKSCLWRWGSAC